MHINIKVSSGTGNTLMNKGVLTGDPIHMVSCSPPLPVPGHQKKGGGVVKAAFWAKTLTG